MKRLLLGLDMDGVVFATPQQYYLPPFIGALRRFKIPISDEDASFFYLNNAGIPIEETYKILLNRHGLPADRTDELGAYWKAHAYEVMPVLYDDVHESLGRVIVHHDIYAWTNMPQHHLDKRVKHHGIERYFARLLGTNADFKGKTYYKETFQGKAVIISDGVPDIAIAKKWECKGILLARSDQYMSRQEAEERLAAGGLDREAPQIITSLLMLPDTLDIMMSGYQL